MTFIAGMDDNVDDEDLKEEIMRFGLIMNFEKDTIPIYSN